MVNVELAKTETDVEGIAMKAYRFSIEIEGRVTLTLERNCSMKLQGVGTNRSLIGFTVSNETVDTI